MRLSNGRHRKSHDVSELESYRKVGFFQVEIGHAIDSNTLECNPDRLSGQYTIYVYRALELVHWAE